jgi:hypothetical protein
VRQSSIGACTIQLTYLIARTSWYAITGDSKNSLSRGTSGIASGTSTANLAGWKVCNAQDCNPCDQAWQKGSTARADADGVVMDVTARKKMLFHSCHLGCRGCEGWSKGPAWHEGWPSDKDIDLGMFQESHGSEFP